MATEITITELPIKNKSFEKLITIDGQLFRIDYILGKSEDISRYIIKTHEEYDGGTPLSYLAIVVFDEVGFICIDSNDYFYIWFRDKNNLYFSEKEKYTKYRI